MKVVVFIQDVTVRIEFALVLKASEPTLSVTAALLFLLVDTAPPFKLFTRAEAVLRDAVMRFLGGLASVDASPEPRVTLEARLVVVLMLEGGEAKVDTPDGISVVMDVPCDFKALVFAFTPANEVVEASSTDGMELSEGDVTVFSELISLEFVSWCISALCCPCCCSSVVVPT